MTKNEIDKFGVIIPRDDFKRISGNYKYNKHLHIKHSYGNLYLTISSKLVTKPDIIPSITPYNIEKYCNEIFNSSGYVISFNTLLNSPLYWLDMKTDCINDTGYSNKDVISILREKTYKNTTKNETPSFGKDKGFETSLLIKSTCKTVKDSLSIYDKIQEIKDTRWLYPDFYSNFSKEFLIKNSNILRFERRLQSSKDIKKAFNLKHLKAVSLIDIFNSNIDVVEQRVQQLYM